MKKIFIATLMVMSGATANAGNFFEDAFSIYVGVMSAGGTFVITEARRAEIEAQVRRDIALRLEQSAVSIRDTKRTILQNEAARLESMVAVSIEMLETIRQTRQIMGVVRTEATTALSSSQRLVHGVRRLLGYSEARSNELQRLQELLQSKVGGEGVSLAEVNAALIGEMHDLDSFRKEIAMVMNASSTEVIRQVQQQAIQVDLQLARIYESTKIYSDQQAFRLQSILAQLEQIQ